MSFQSVVLPVTLADTLWISAEFPGRLVIESTSGCRAGTWVLPLTSLG